MNVDVIIDITVVLYFHNGNLKGNNNKLNYMSIHYGVCVVGYGPGVCQKNVSLCHL